ncbi:EAL domain-containing protein [Roseibium sediminicola]|uniref:EAL domain-containing protein n=1 Tax=Roseibium sediminicola TaxID=2933272 RepID=A0ABT0GQ78_9HYPH|nr:EAL domain-containing protein [Roseibium sp. CAU 1639]MCK7611020.1 EAL domain-containing protein [Roseibium sp. CAU 1639]
MKIDVIGFADVLSRIPMLNALQRGLALTLPLIMVGALALLFQHPPFPELKPFFAILFGPQFDTVLSILVSSTFGIAALLAMCGYAYVYSNLRNTRESTPIASPVLVVMVTVTCFFVLVAPTEQATLQAAISLSFGLPVALLVAIGSTEVFLRLARMQVLRIKSKSIGQEGMIGDVFTIMPAAGLTIILFAILKAVLLSLGSTDVVADLNGTLAKTLTSGADTLGFGLTYIIVSQVFWLFGIHGPNVLQAVQDLQMAPASIANNIAVIDGKPPEFIFTSQFFDLLHMGGSGATLGLIIAMLLVSRSPSTRNFALLAALPALCNVNEPLLYGLPIVLNPIFALPFLLVPVVNTIVMYLAMSTDFMPLTGHQVAWTTPAIINGYAVTGSVNGALVQALCLLISVVVYAPFVRLSERVAALKGQAALQSLLVITEQGDNRSAGKRLLSRTGDLGRLALSLAGDLEIAVKRRGHLFLEYQPQICLRSGRAFGAEALLRWDHPVHGRIPPPVIIQLAEDLGIMPELGDFVLDLACAQRKDWQGSVPDDFMIAVNVAPAQILSGTLDQRVFARLDAHFLPTHVLMLEITESTMLIPDDAALASLERMREHGVRIALDDFGMGHTSLRYLRALPLDEVKIDRSLTQSDQGEVSGHIISSILDLSRSLDFSTVVEGVESEDQLARLQRLGCTRFQGYFFSRPQAPDQCLAFIRSLAEKAERAA